MVIHDAAPRSKSDPDGDGRLNDHLRDYLLTQGADLVGFGSVQHLEGAPEIMQPRRYLPDAQSMQRDAPVRGRLHRQAAVTRQFTKRDANNDSRLTLEEIKR